MNKISKHFGIFIALAFGSAVLSIPTTALAADILVVEGDRVAIGKSTPQAPLEVDADGSTVGIGNAVVLLKKTGSLGFQLDDISVAGFWNFSNTAGETEFRISKSGTGQTELKLTSAGNLTIAGDIFTGSCNPCISDYVFESDYKLMPLEEVGAFIKKNGHLPNIPSEADYQKRGGVAIHELSVKLLEKIEELTLHTIEQQKMINELMVSRQNQKSNIIVNHLLE